MYTHILQCIVGVECPYNKQRMTCSATTSQTSETASVAITASPSDNARHKIDYRLSIIVVCQSVMDDITTVWKLMPDQSSALQPLILADDF